MTAPKPLTVEELRILRAAAEGRLTCGHSSGRWQIAGEPRPDRKSRERLKKRGLIDYAAGSWTVLEATPLGRSRLDA